MSVATTWGTTAEERRMAYPCDRFLEGADAAYYRGITIRARPEVIFRWLCQLREASYSYDWRISFGRGSRQELTPGLDELAIGQGVMDVFELVDFERDRHLTIRLTQDTLESRVYGPFLSALAASYLIVPQAGDCCRLLVKLLMRYRRGPIAWFARVLGPWADLIMMRKQLLNLRKLSERMQGNG